MKKLLLAASLAITAALALGSCGSNEGKDPLLIPDSASVGQLLPVIQGNIDTLFNIVPEQYTVEFDDTAASITIKLKHVKACGIANSFCTTYVTDGDTADIARRPFIVFLDQDGNEIDGVTLPLDEYNAREMSRLISSPLNSETKLNFYTTESVDYDDLADRARNIKLVAGLANVPDTAKISNLLLEFSTATNTFNNKWSHNTRPRYKNQLDEFLIDRGTMEVTEEEADKAVPYMRPDQLTRYKRIKAGVKHLKLDDEFDIEE